MHAKNMFYPSLLVTASAVVGYLLVRPLYDNIDAISVQSLSTYLTLEASVVGLSTFALLAAIRRASQSNLRKLVTSALFCVVLIQITHLTSSFLLAINWFAFADQARTETYARTTFHENIARIEGHIGPTTASSFNETVGAGHISLLHIESTGGYINSAMEIARLVQEKEIDILVSGECESACTLIALAGTRLFLTKEAALGFHRGSFSGEATTEFSIYSSENATKNMLYWLSELNVSQEIIELVTETPSNEMAYLYPEELRDIALNVVLLSTSKSDLSGTDS